MTLTRDELLAEILKLDPGERESLAEEVLLSISDAEQAQIDAAWIVEVRRRDADLTAGTATARPVGEVIERLKAKARR